MNEERIKEIFSNEEFVKRLLKQEDSEQVQALLIEKDIDLSIEDICKIRELFIKQMNGEINLEELMDEDLENVAGGIKIYTVVDIYNEVIDFGNKIGDKLDEWTRRRW